MPMSTKNGFVKQNNLKTSNNSFSGPTEVRKYYHKYIKNEEIVANSPTGTSQTFNSYI